MDRIYRIKRKSEIKHEAHELLKRKFTELMLKNFVTFVSIPENKNSDPVHPVYPCVWRLFRYCP